MLMPFPGNQPHRRVENTVKINLRAPCLRLFLICGLNSIVGMNHMSTLRFNTAGMCRLAVGHAVVEAIRLRNSSFHGWLSGPSPTAAGEGSTCVNAQILWSRV